jgi:general stress protein 26
MSAQRENDVPTTSDPKDLHDLLKEFSTVLLGTFEQNGERPSLRARPMSIAKLDSDCSLYFITQASTDKVDEASATRFGHVFAQSKSRYGSIQGDLVISRDRALVRQLWSKACEVWLDGPDDPDAAVIIFRPREAELWDLSGSKGLRFMLESARALATGDKTPDYPAKMHERVQVR